MDLASKGQKVDKKSKATTSTIIFLSFKLEDISPFPVGSQQCPPTSLGRATHGLPREQEEQFAHSQPRHGGFGRRKKKDTQYPKSLSQGHHVKNFPSFPPHVAPLLSSSLLFFFNQAVWGCQVF